MRKASHTLLVLVLLASLAATRLDAQSCTSYVQACLDYTCFNSCPGDPGDLWELPLDNYSLLTCGHNYDDCWGGLCIIGLSQVGGTCQGGGYQLLALPAF